MRSVSQYLFLLAAVSFSALANPTPSDPEILIDIGDAPFNLSTDFNAIQPDGTTQSLAFDFHNDTGGIVTSLTFNTTINKNLSDTSAFNCPADPGYFFFCKVNYDGPSGALQYQFFGVDPPEGDENFALSGDNEFGEHEGIPIGGDFKITLEGWTVGPDTASLYATLPQFDNTFTATPEPSQLVLLAVASLLLVSIAGIIRRREKRKEESISTI